MRPSEIHSQRILISPLNWGFGHLSRCIPLISEFLKNENQIYFAGNQKQILIIKQYFPSIECLEFPDYPFKFNINRSLRFNLFIRIPMLIKRWRDELKEVESICRQLNIGIVISDHRYGFRSTNSLSIFVTHQVRLPLHWYEGIIQFIHRRALKKFNEVWILDDENFYYAGILSKNRADLNVRYIGIRSRFELYGNQKDVKENQIVIVVSGPLPYAEKFALEQSNIYMDKRATIILPVELKHLNLSKTLNVIFSENWIACDRVILRSNTIVSKSGYSTLMDILYLGVSFTITPTCGQAEQEYLFTYWNEHIIPRMKLKT